MGLLQDIRAALAPVGLNLIGTTPRSDYEALVPPQYHIEQQFPETQTVVVIGNGGGEFWGHFREYAKVRPNYLQQHEHPLDDYTVEVIRARLTPLLDTARARYRLIYPFQFFSGLTVSFMHLAQAARLSVPSILGVQIHPRYGPWIAWRAAVLIDHDLPALPAPAQDFDPCATLRGAALYSRLSDPGRQRRTRLGTCLPARSIASVSRPIVLSAVTLGTPASTAVSIATLRTNSPIISVSALPQRRRTSRSPRGQTSRLAANFPAHRA